jgi:predicted alpha/beta-fold hydrolase
MCSDETEIYCQNTVKMAAKAGYQPVLIQYRGSSGIELTSPMTYGCGQYQDVTEAIDYIHEEYCVEIDRKIFALGFSMGGNWLGMALCKNKHSFSDKIVAAACM